MITGCDLVRQIQFDSCDAIRHVHRKSVLTSGGLVDSKWPLGRCALHERHRLAPPQLQIRPERINNFLGVKHPG